MNQSLNNRDNRSSSVNTKRLTCSRCVYEHSSLELTKCKTKRPLFCGARVTGCSHSSDVTDRAVLTTAHYNLSE